MSGEQFSLDPEACAVTRDVPKCELPTFGGNVCAGCSRVGIDLQFPPAIAALERAARHHTVGERNPAWQPFCAHRKRRVTLEPSFVPRIKVAVLRLQHDIHQNPSSAWRTMAKVVSICSRASR